MVLFNWRWLRLMNKLSLIRSLDLFASEARMRTYSRPLLDATIAPNLAP